MPGIMQITGIRKTIQSREREGATMCRRCLLYTSCSAVQFTEVLTAYSAGSGNTEENSIISRIAPIVPVYDLNFQYKVWDTD